MSYNIIKCECGIEIRESWLKRHLRSDRHKIQLIKENQQKEIFKMKKECLEKMEQEKRERIIKTLPKAKGTINLRLSIMD